MVIYNYVFFFGDFIVIIVCLYVFKLIKICFEEFVVIVIVLEVNGIGRKCISVN